MIVVYLRVSSEEQRQNQSIELQRIEMQAFCAARHYKDVEIIEDDGYSGTIPLPDRPGGARLVSLLGSGKVEHVLLWAGDRLGRDISVLVNAIERIERAGAVLESKREGVLSLKDTGKILMTCVQMGMAATERAQISDRVRTRYFQLAEQGRPTGGKVLFGYTTTADKKEVIQPDEAEAVRRVYKLASAGKSSPKIAEEMNRVGLLNRGTPWTPKRVRNLLMNPTYRGEYFYGKLAPVVVDGKKLQRATPREQWLSRPCPAIVTPALWQKANEEIHKNQIVAMAHAKNDYLLRGLIVCGCCGLKYISTAVGAPGKERFYYRCHGSRAAAGPYGKKGERCPNKSLVGKVIEQLVWVDLQHYIGRPGDAVAALRKKLAVLDREQPIAAEIARMEKRLASRVEARNRVLEQYQDGVISKFQQNEHLMRINTETTGLEKGLSELRKRARDTQANVHQLQSVETMLLDLQKSLGRKPNFAARRRIVEALVKEIRVDPVTGTHVSYVFPAPTARQQDKSLPSAHSALR
ncbi:MAG TPA: recombinase family protein [Bryobacteraceae bacterium]|jgi:site-specific DNA recombinase|nr:recombinase family protein [Bryobacteraceae bacterium]